MPFRGAAARLVATLVVMAALTTLSSMAQESEPITEEAIPTEEEQAEAEAPAGLLPIPPYGGPLGQRLKLTGDWGGFRAKLAEHGVQINVDWYQSYFGGVSGGVDPLGRRLGIGKFALQLFSGGLGLGDLVNFGRTLGRDRREPDLEYTGALDYTVLLDTGAMGLWRGGLLVLHGETLYGDYPNQDTGALVPLQLRTALPEGQYPITTLSHIIYTQFFSEEVNVVIGKLPTFLTVDLPFLSEVGTSDFGNFSLQENTVNVLMLPYTAWGAELHVRPTERLELKFGVFDTEGDASVTNFDTIFDEGTSFAASLRLTTEFFDLPGQHFFAGVYADDEFAELDSVVEIQWGGITTRTARRGIFSRIFDDSGSFVSRAANFAGDRFGPQIIGTRTTGSSWSISYAGMQYLHFDPETSRGTAAFIRLSLGDDDTTPIEGLVNIGLWGKGPFASRPTDEWGIAYFHNDVNDHIPGILELGDEHGVEVFYKFMVTPWLDITPSFQIVDPARQNADTLYATGLRMNVRF